MSTRKPRRTFTTDFKQQIIQLFENGKSRGDILREYDLTPSAFDRWVRQHRNSGSFREKDNRIPEENELILLKRENARLRTENDILKQSALIIGRK